MGIAVESAFTVDCLATMVAAITARVATVDRAEVVAALVMAIVFAATPVAEQPAAKVDAITAVKAAVTMGCLAGSEAIMA